MMITGQMLGISVLVIIILCLLVEWRFIGGEPRG